MALIGFSTGALAKGDFLSALTISRQLGLNAVELSALRTLELAPLVEFSIDADLIAFRYVSLHAPTDYVEDDEALVVDTLERTAHRGWPIIIHPDRIHSFELWRRLGARVLIENMDKRKPVGRTVEEPRSHLLAQLPAAGMCF